jgi:Putative zinc-finger
VRGHADAQQLAAFREGLLPARKAAKVAAHLSSCPRCAEVDAQLAAVTTILARTPAPPMPASLAARLDAALAAEIARSPVAASPPDAAAASPTGAAPPADAAARPSATAPPGADSPVGAASPAGAPAPGERAGHRTGPASGRDAAGRGARPPRSPWRLTPRLAAAAAAVVLVAGGGYAIARVALAGNSSEQSSSASSSASRSAPSGSAVARAPEAAPGAAIRGGLPLVASGTSYQAGQLPAQVGAVLKRYPAPEGSPGRPTVASPVSPQSAFPQLNACVSHLAGGQRPRLVDIARYGTRPAAVIVVPVPGTATLRIWVVGPGCTGQGGDVIARSSLPAPG